MLVIVIIFAENQGVNSLLDCREREDKINNKESLNLKDSHSNEQKHLSFDIHIDFSNYFLCVKSSFILIHANKFKKVM